MEKKPIKKKCWCGNAFGQCHQPIEEKWKESLNSLLFKSIDLESENARPMSIKLSDELVSFIENLLEQERKKLVKQIDSFPLSDSMFFDENNWSEIRKVARFISILLGYSKRRISPNRVACIALFLIDYFYKMLSSP